MICAMTYDVSKWRMYVDDENSCLCVRVLCMFREAL